MSLPAGTRLGPYEILAPIGAVRLAYSTDGTWIPHNTQEGVFVVVKATNAYVSGCFNEYPWHPDPTGQYAALYRPYHLASLEAPLSRRDRGGQRAMEMVDDRLGDGIGRPPEVVDRDRPAGRGVAARRDEGDDAERERQEHGAPDPHPPLVLGAGRSDGGVEEQQHGARREHQVRQERDRQAAGLEQVCTRSDGHLE